MKLIRLAQRFALPTAISALLIGFGAAAEPNQDIANARAEMQAALQRLYRVTPRAVEVENEQDAWRKSNPMAAWSPNARPESLPLITARTEQFISWTEKTDALLHHRFTRQDIAQKCIPVPPPGEGTITPDCQVEEFGPIDGRRDLRFQIYHSPAQSDALRMPIYESPSTTVIFFSTSQRDDEFEIAGWSDMYAQKPYTIGWRNSATMLVLPDFPHGSGSYVHDRAYVIEEPRKVWLEVDVNNWEENLQERLPKGLSTNRGHSVDYGRGIGQVFLARPSDPNCCPSGGRAIVQLLLRSGRLQIESFRIDPTIPSFTGFGGVLTAPSLR